MKDWLYKGEIIQDISELPSDTYGFVYEITHLPSNKKYIGKKVLYFERNKKLGKRELEALKEERQAKGLKGRVPAKKKVVLESDWKTYYGSNQEIKDLIKEGKHSEFKREILTLVTSKKLLTYYECKELFIREVLENQDYYNGDILGKFHRKDFL